MNGQDQEKHSMAYTATDLENVRAAILALATGDRVTSVSFSNGKAVQYGQATLPELRQLEATIASQVGGRRRFMMATTSKGF
jgi:hypothetical protein